MLDPCVPQQSLLTHKRFYPQLWRTVLRVGGGVNTSCFFSARKLGVQPRQMAPHESLSPSSSRAKRNRISSAKPPLLCSHVLGKSEPPDSRTIAFLSGVRGVRATLCLGEVRGGGLFFPDSALLVGASI